MAERRFNFLILVPVVILFAIVFAAGLALLERQQALREGRDPNAPKFAMQGQIVPDVTLEALAGRTSFTAADLRAPGMKLVNFWASWCAPCRAEHPALERLAGEGVAIFGVNYRDKSVDAIGFLDELGDPYAAIGADPNGRNGIDWGVVAMPETFVVDGEGKIVLRHAGPITERVLNDVIYPALNK